MSTQSMLAKIGMTREQVARVAKRCGEKPAEDEGEEFETGEDLLEALSENRVGYVSDFAASADAMYHGITMRD